MQRILLQYLICNGPKLETIRVALSSVKDRIWCIQKMEQYASVILQVCLTTPQTDFTNVMLSKKIIKVKHKIHVV